MLLWGRIIEGGGFVSLTGAIRFQRGRCYFNVSSPPGEVISTDGEFFWGAILFHDTGFSSTASSALPEKDRIARMGTALCSSPGAVFGRVLFGLRASPSSTMDFFENFSAMFF